MSASSSQTARTHAHERHEIKRAFHRFPKAVVSGLGDRETAVLESLLRRRVTVTASGRAATVRTLLAAAESSSPGAIAFLKGGAPRDIVARREPRDVDAVYMRTDRTAVLAAWRAQFGADLRLSISAKAIGLVGVGAGTDSFEISALHLHECAADCTANSLLIHVPTRTLIDPFGAGERDARESIWRIPCSDRRAWADAVRFAIWRMLKFRVRGFQSSLDDRAFVYTHFMAEADHHSPAVFTTAAADALATDSRAVLKAACDDVMELRRAGRIDFEPHDFLMLLVEKGVLAPPEPRPFNNGFPVRAPRESSESKPDRRKRKPNGSSKPRKKR